MKQESEQLNCELGSSDSEVHNIRSTGLQTAEEVEWKNMYPTSLQVSIVRYASICLHCSVP